MQLSIVTLLALASTALAQNATVSAPSNGTMPSAPSWNATSYTTTLTVSGYTTYCPSPTTFVQGSQTYTVTGPTTLTVTNCPCTITSTITRGTGGGSGQGGNSIGGSGTATTSPLLYTGAARVVKPALAVMAVGAVAFL